MRKICTVLVMLLCTVLICTGCQDSPQEDIVVNKNEIHKETKGESTDLSEKNSVSDKFSCENSGIQFEVNAEAEELEKKPVLRVKPHQIQSEEVKKWANVLFGAVPVYEPIRELSKEDIEDSILKYKQWSDEEQLYEEYGNEAEVKKVLEEYQKRISWLKGQYESAPEKVERKKTDWTFHPSEYYFTDAGYWEEQKDQYDYLENTYCLEIASMDDSTGHFPVISATNRDQSDYKVNMLWFYYDDETQMDDIPYLELSEEEAKKLIDEKKKDLNLYNWGMVKLDKFDEENECSFRFTYLPEFLGISTLLCPEIDMQADDVYAASYYYSKLEIVVYNGIIQSVCLTSPLDIVETVEEDTDTLPFEKIYQQFRTQMNLQYSEKGTLANLAGDESAEVKIKVSDIRNGLFRIKEKNNEDTFLMVPAWSFTGVFYINGDAFDEINLCYVNTIDGSIIDPKLGY